MPGLEVVPGALVELGACEPGRAELRVLPCARAVVPRASGFVQMPGGILPLETQPWWCCDGDPHRAGCPQRLLESCSRHPGLGSCGKGRGLHGHLPKFLLMLHHSPSAPAGQGGALQLWDKKGKKAQQGTGGRQGAEHGGAGREGREPGGTRRGLAAGLRGRRCQDKKFVLGRNQAISFPALTPRLEREERQAARSLLLQRLRHWVCLWHLAAPGQHHPCPAALGGNMSGGVPVSEGDLPLRGLQPPMLLGLCPPVDPGPVFGAVLVPRAVPWFQLWC